jgi:CAAX prenyl protease-like protein
MSFQPATSDPNSPAPQSQLGPLSWRTKLLADQPWLTFVLPLAVFLVVTALEPKPPEPAPAFPAAAQADLPFDPDALAANEVKPQGEPDKANAAKNETQPAAGWFGISIPYSAYPIIYSIKLELVFASMLFVLPGYRQFPWRFSPLSVIVGVVGVVVWVGLCHLQLEQKWLPKIGLGMLVDSGQRSSFNPLVELPGNPLAAYGFLAIRFIGLVLIVPVIEEFFLRGFLMRVVIHENWTAVPFGTVTWLAVVAGTAAPILMHPGEMIAAAVWFTMVTALMVRTRNIWDCVIAHGVTNLLMGLYAVIWNQWQLL